VSAPALAANVLAADDVGPGGTGFLVVVLLIVVVVALIFALRHSLKSLRRNVDNGTFADHVEQETRHKAGHGVSRDRRSDEDA